jgi:benzoate membrane transport protein
MGKDISLQAVTMGLITAFVGWASSFTVILQGLTAVGATQAQAASGLFAASLAMGLAGLWTSLSSRQPISVAWSTPGAALLATTGPVEGGFAAAVGAFFVCGALIVAAGYWDRLGRWVAAIPAALANAMLAGVLFGLCLAPVKAVAQLPLQGLAVVVVWAAVARWKRLFAVPAAVIVTLAIIASGLRDAPDAAMTLWSPPVLVVPGFGLQAIVGIALPLFLVTMASQNIPGFAVLKVYGYAPAPGPLFRLTGFFSMAASPLGGHAVNLSALTAAMCAGPDAHADPARRYWASATVGFAYAALAFGAGAAAAFVAAAPPILIQAVAGLALLGALAGAVHAALQDADTREAALVTFLVTASGLSFFGISGAFWGLIAGGGLLALSRWRRPTA